MTQSFFDTVRNSLFKGSLSQLQVDGMNDLGNEFALQDGQDLRQLAYVLATVYHETGQHMQPVKEFGSEEYLKSKKYYPYYGRDLTQTTWLSNYQKVKNFSGIDVVSQPELIGQMPLAAQVAIKFMSEGWYTGKKLADYFNSTTEDYINARKIINGLDCAVMIADYAKIFYNALESS